MPEAQHLDGQPIVPRAPVRHLCAVRVRGADTVTAEMAPDGGDEYEVVFRRETVELD